MAAQQIRRWLGHRLPAPPLPKPQVMPHLLSPLFLFPPLRWGNELGRFPRCPHELIRAQASRGNVSASSSAAPARGAEQGQARSCPRTGWCQPSAATLGWGVAPGAAPCSLCLCGYRPSCFSPSHPIAQLPDPAGRLGNSSPWMVGGWWIPGLGPRYRAGRSSAQGCPGQGGAPSPSVEQPEHPKHPASCRPLQGAPRPTSALPCAPSCPPALPTSLPQERRVPHVPSGRVPAERGAAAPPR